MNLPWQLSEGYEVYFRRIPEISVVDKPLGRHVRWDSRNVMYPYRATLPMVALADQLWDRHIPILDQGSVGSCTGNAETGLLGTEPYYDTLVAAGKALNGEQTALALYSAAETIDGDGPYPPNDNGSTGPSVCQAAKNEGLISGYLHVMNSKDMADALQTGPLIVGVNWYDSFDVPDSKGLIQISPGAYVRGGHEFLVRGVKIADMMFLADNSWGPGWGNHGSMEYSWNDMDRLFSEQGDCTQSVPLTAPAPVPIPVPVNPDHLFWFGGSGQHMMEGGLRAWCQAMVRTRPDLRQLQLDAEEWAHSKGYLP